ncbi:MAG: DUF5615 family PIN-like protein [Ignavibacteriaceae bacterium]
MKFLCDVHLPKKLIQLFNEHNIEAIHGSTILDGWQTKDLDFCRYADENNYIMVTKDSDFRNSHFLQNTPLQLVKINLGNISNNNLLSIFEKYLSAFEKIFENKIAYIEVNKESITVLVR